MGFLSEDCYGPPALGFHCSEREAKLEKVVCVALVGKPWNCLIPDLIKEDVDLSL